MVEATAAPLPELEIEIEARRAHAAAFGVGASFAGAALVVLGVSGSALLSASVFVVGVVATALLLRRHRHDDTGRPLGTHPVMEEVERAIIDLRAEAEATDSTLRRAAERRVAYDTAIH